MIGKNRRVIASILSVALIASALPVSAAFAVETTGAETSVSETATTGLAIRNITLKQLLNVPDGNDESNWNVTFAKQMEATDEATYGKNFSKDDYVSMIEGIANVMPVYKDMIMNIYNSDDTVITSSLKDGVITISADVEGLSAMVNEKVNDQIAAAAGDYAEKFGELTLSTNLDMTVNLVIDTNAVKEDKTISVKFGAVCDEDAYDAFGMFDLAETKLKDVKAEFNALFAKAETELGEAETKLTTAKKQLDDAKAALDDAEKSGVNVAEKKAEYDAKLAEWEQANADVEAAKDKLDEANVKAEEVSAVFDRYIDKVSSMKQSASNALELSVKGEGEKADEAYTVLYDAIMSKNGVPQAIKDQIPSSLEGFLASKAFASSLSFMNNITPEEVSSLLRGATDVTMELKNGAFEIIGTVVDEQGTKEVTLKLDASALETASTADIFFNVRMIKRATETEVSESEPVSSDTDESGSDTEPVGSETSIPEGSESGEGSETSVPEGSESGEGSETSIPEGSESGEGSETSVSEGSETEGSETSVSEGSETGGSETSVSEGSETEGSETSGSETGTPSGDTFDVNVLLGDNDSSDTVDSLDALKILQNTVGLVELTNLQTVASDVDFNGQISSLDALKVLQKTVAVIDEFEDANKVFALYVNVKFENEDMDKVVGREYFRADKTTSSPISYAKFGFDAE